MGAFAAVLLLAGGIAGACAAADPAASDWYETDQGKVRLIAGATAVGGDRAQLGLEFRLAPGWKVYWRSPGDAGLPPTIDWTGSANLAGAEIAWPAPRRFSAYGLETIGYEDAVVLPITARLAEPGKALSLRAGLRYLTCKDICIPYEGKLALDLPAGAGSTAPGADLIASFLARVPGTVGREGLRVVGATLTPGKEPLLSLGVEADAALTGPDAFIEGPAGLAFGAPRFAPSADRHSGTLTIPLSGTAAALNAAIGAKLRVTLVDGDRAVEAETVAMPGMPPRDLGLLAAMLGIALLGGFILNFMPCVLPVLSIKLLAVAAQAGRPQRAIRAAFLATASGIIASFLALAVATLGLKAGGFAVGWGMQFQQPVFLIAMAALIAVFACNLAGFFEIPLPGWLGALAAGGPRSGLAGDVAAGAVATLLATPCSAPFLGTAVGFALAGDALDVLAVFTALGLGLALPFLGVASVPAMAAHLPRPGRWMLTLRRILALCLAATAVWLLSVLAAQTSLAIAGAAAAALVAAALLLRFAPVGATRRATVAATLLGALAIPAILPAPAAGVAAAGGVWQRFDPAAIAALVREGKAVFVDVTADWCLNCKLNERLVLDSAAVAQRLARPEIVAMRADWTRPDEGIGAFLRGFGRFGIPFYAVFGPATPEGQGLPEILTQAQVLEALRKAAPDAANRAVVTAPAGAREGG